MNPQTINDEAANSVITKAVHYLVRAVKAIEKKYGKPCPSLSSEFIVGTKGECWKLTITRMKDGQEVEVLEL